MAGFGSSIVAMPLLTMLIDLKSAVALCILNGLIITSYLCIQLRPHLDKRKILPLFIGSL
ncbi:sulfite exporter TauE/SafE family protein, partial [bacterium]|nr:sulfite exporter TauE/SafE family protein [bacterium]